MNCKINPQINRNEILIKITTILAITIIMTKYNIEIKVEIPVECGSKVR